MKNKIIVSLLLIFLIAISASAVSASEDLSDTIEMTSDSTDIELGAVDEEAVSEVNNDINEDIITSTDSEELGEGGLTVQNNITVSNINAFVNYVGTDKSDEGNAFILNEKNDYIFNLTAAQNIKRSCTIVGGTIQAENLDYFFNVESPSNGGPSALTIKNTKFLITKAQSVVFAKGQTEGVNKVLNIAGITFENITLEIADGVSPTDVSLLYIDDIPLKNTFSNEINLIDNTLNGANGINIKNTVMDVTHIDATEIIYPKETMIYSMDAIHYAIDKAVGDEAFLYQVILMDKNGFGLPNQTVKFAIDELGQLTAITDERGIASLRLSLASIRKYTVITLYEGDESQGYNPSGMVANTIQIFKKDVSLAVKNLSYKVTATKKLTATFKVPVFDKYGVLKSYKLLSNKKVTFTVNGKTYSANTNSKGVATVKISLNKKGTYTYTAKYAGDAKYNAVTKKGKLTIVPLATSLATKKYTFKKAAKTKKISVTLKSGKTALKSQKITLKVNGKTYTAKTNSKGIATIKIALNKKGTFKYSVKYAGNNKYKAISKTNKVIIK